MWETEVMIHSTFAALRGSWCNGADTRMAECSKWQGDLPSKDCMRVPTPLGVPLDEEMLAVGSEGQVTF